MKFKLILITATFILLHCSVQCIEDSKAKKILSHLLPSDYEKNLVPVEAEGSPLQLNASLYIEDINSISENNMEFTTVFFLTQFWNDHRLKWNASETNISSLVLEEELVAKLWLPNTVFGQTKSTTIYKTTASKEETNLGLYSNGNIHYTIKISLVGKCSMDLSYFPIDKQKCSLYFGSYGTNTASIKYNWMNSSSKSFDFDEPAVEFASNINLPTFRLVGYSKLTDTDTWLRGKYSELHLTIYIERNLTFYLARMYLPACFLVIISWLPFWLDRDSHARVALGVTTILTMTTLITNSSSELPKISYLTTMDVYLFFCFIMVFLSLIEYATVGYYDLMLSTKSQEKDGPEVDTEMGTSKAKPYLIADTNIIDYFARKIFPISFIFFNIAYIATLWCLTLTSNDDKPQILF